MEIQDVPAIVAAARRRKVPVALDNTYSAGVLFDAFAHGVDVSMQALTKYVGGHSDLLLGSVSVAGSIAYEAIGSTLKQLGMAVSPDDCSLALRGMKTLGVRLERLEKSALEIALWLSKQPCIKNVLHPALPSCPGHEYWRRDFTGSSSIFSIVFDERFTADQAIAFADRLTLFKIGFSWGGVTSLVIVYPNLDRPGNELWRTLGAAQCRARRAGRSDRGSGSGARRHGPGPLARHAIRGDLVGDARPGILRNLGRACAVVSSARRQSRQVTERAPVGCLLHRAVDCTAWRPDRALFADIRGGVRRPADLVAATRAFERSQLAGRRGANDRRARSKAIV